MPEKTQKQHTQEFENCVQDVMNRGHEKESAFAICTATFQRAGKPIYIGESNKRKLHLFSESITIDGNKVSGVAIHPKRIFHPDEGLTHVYMREELEKAAPTLVGKPFGIDHLYVLPPPNIIRKAWFDRKQNGVAFEGLVDDKIAKQIRNKVFKGLSVELNWLKPGGKVEYVNGVAPRNFELTSVHFLRRFPPGDREAYIRLWEQLVAGPPLPLDKRVEAIEKQIQDLQNQVNVIGGKLDVLVVEPKKHQLPPPTKDEPDQSQPSQMDKADKNNEASYASENEDIVALRKSVFDLEAQLAESEKRIQSLRRKHADFRKMVESVIPQRSIWGAWRPGCKLMVQQLQRVLRESSDS